MRMKVSIFTPKAFSQGKAAANALQLISILLGKPVEAPATLVEVYPELESFAETELPAQQALFAAPHL